MIVASLDDWREYFSGPLWESAFRFLSTAPADIADGRHVIDGDLLFVNAATYAPRPLEGARYEAHQAYLDIQYVLEGCEWMHVVHRSAVVPLGGYDAAGDVRFFEQGGERPTRVALAPGTFAVLYPEDAHMPGIISGEGNTVRKLVVKVRLAALPPVRNADLSS